MTLDEIFEKYHGSEEFRRKNKKSLLNMSYDLEWLKGLRAYGCQEAIDLGFIIHKSMIEDANADDWACSNKRTPRAIKK